MKRLWAPWRIEYIEEEKPEYCIFCKAFNEKKDEKNLVLWRGKHSFVMLNRFPYNSGHMMIAPIRHLGDFEDLNQDEMLEIGEAIQLAMKVLRKVMNPHGFNIGMNLGRVAGAGVEDHIHVHIVPRWDGDTNYMPIISDTKVIPEALSRTYNKLLQQFNLIIKTKKG